MIPDILLQRDGEIATLTRSNPGHKKFVRRLDDPRPLSQAEHDESHACFDTADFREGVAGFLAKRKPRFTGK